MVVVRGRDPVAEDAGPYNEITDGAVAGAGTLLDKIQAAIIGNREIISQR